MLQAERDYLVRMIGYFEACVGAYNRFLSRVSYETGSDAELRAVAERCRDDCVRWQQELEQIYVHRNDPR